MLEHHKAWNFAMRETSTQRRCSCRLHAAQYWKAAGLSFGSARYFRLGLSVFVFCRYFRWRIGAASNQLTGGVLNILTALGIFEYLVDLKRNVPAAVWKYTPIHWKVKAFSFPVAWTISRVPFSYIWDIYVSFHWGTDEGSKFVRSVTILCAQVQHRPPRHPHTWTRPTVDTMQIKPLAASKTIWLPRAVRLASA